MSSVVANPSSSSAAALSISSLESTIQRMLSHPQMFNGFIDILKLPVVQSTLSTLTNNISDPQKQKQRRHDALIRTLELFAYGSVGEYHDLISKEEGGGGVWSLNEVMLEKLRMLTVVSVVARRVNGGNNEEEMGNTTKNCDVERHVEMKMADAALSERTQIMAKRSNRAYDSKSKKKGGKANYNATMLSIPYTHLASELRMPYTKVDGSINNDMASQESTTKNIRQLEDLLIKCIYSNIISAKLDQLSQCLIVQPHLMLDNTGGDFVGWETFFGASSSSSVENGDEDESGCGGKGGGRVRVHGSILSRDLHTLTPESTMVEITRMSSSLHNFLERSNILLVSLERLSNTTIVHHRKLDEKRWAEVRKVVEEAPSKMREMSMTSPSSSSSLTHQSSVAFASNGSANSPAGERSNAMRVGWGGGGTTGGGFDGGENLMEVMDVMGSSGSCSSRQRQVKRSKGGHSMMMERYGQ